MAKEKLKKVKINKKKIFELFLKDPDWTNMRTRKEEVKKIIRFLKKAIKKLVKVKFHS